MSRRALQERVERLVADRVAPIALRVFPRRDIILAYHNVVPDEGAPAGERSLHLPVARFREQLDRLMTTHDVVPLPALLASAERPRRPRAAITFDDAYAGCLDLGLPAVEERALAATVFVAPGLLGAAACWWDVLATESGGELDPGERDRLLTTLRGDASAILAARPGPGNVPTPPPSILRIATEDELLRAARRRGIAIGAHSWSHRNLAVLAPEELRAELAAPLAWLQERIAGVLPWLAFPYGAHTDATTRAAFDAGYQAVLRVTGGRILMAHRRTRCLPRLNVPRSMSTPRFALKVAGLIPD